MLNAQKCDRYSKSTLSNLKYQNAKCNAQFRHIYRIATISFRTLSIQYNSLLSPLERTLDQKRDIPETLHHFNSRISPSCQTLLNSLEISRYKVRKVYCLVHPVLQHNIRCERIQTLHVSWILISLTDPAQNIFDVILKPK